MRGAAGAVAMAGRMASLTVMDTNNLRKIASCLQCSHRPTTTTASKVTQGLPVSGIYVPTEHWIQTLY